MPIDLGATDSKEEAEAAKVLKNLARSCKNAEDRLLSMRRKLQAPTIKAKLGEISEEIYHSDQCSQNDIFSRLPNELKCAVWSDLDDAADRLMFALTCKSNAATFESLKVSKQQPVSAKSSKAASSKSKANIPSNKQVHASKIRKTTKKVSKSDLIPVLQRLQAWMPLSYKLCYECLRFRPRHAKADEKSFAENGGWGGKVLPDIIGKLTPAKVRSVTAQGQRCPECCVRKHLETQEMKQEFKTMLEIIRNRVGINT